MMSLEKVFFHHRYVIVGKVQSMVKLGFALTNFMQYVAGTILEFAVSGGDCELQSQKVYSYTLTARTLTLSLSRLSIPLHLCTAHSYFFGHGNSPPLVCVRNALFALIIAIRY